MRKNIRRNNNTLCSRVIKHIMVVIMAICMIFAGDMPVAAQELMNNNDKYLVRARDVFADDTMYFDSYKRSDDAWYLDFNYWISGDNIVISNYFGSASELVIPNKAVVDGKEYTVRLNDDCSYFFADNQSLSSVSFSRGIDSSQLTNMSGMFSACSNLKNVDVTNLDTSNVTNMSGMFSECTSLTHLDLSGLDTGNVTGMSSMFFGCSNLIFLNLNGFNTSKVTNMSDMFCWCTSLTDLNIGGFDTSRVEDMSAMFCQCTSLVNLDVSSFNTQNVKYMFDMFGNSYVSSLDMSHWDLRNLQCKTTEHYTQDYRGMFAQCFRLGEIKTPLNLNVDIPIYYSFKQQDNPSLQYTSLPTNQSNSITLVNNVSYVPLIGISMSPTAQTIKVGESFGLNINLIPEDASNYNYYVDSNNPAVANVEIDGYGNYKVAGTGEGTAVITCVADEGGYSAQCIVTVEGFVNKEIKQIYDYSWQVLDLVNQERAKVGVAPLVMDKGMLNIARQRAEELTILFEHTRPDGSHEALPNGYKNSVDAGENIAKGQKTPSEVVDSWMNSQGHRENMLNSGYKSIGIGCVCEPGIWGDTYYWSQNFYGEVVEPILRGGVPTSPVTTDDGTTPMYRMYNPNSGEHFYTSNYQEIVNLGQAGWQYEDVAWFAKSGGDEVYRLYNSAAGDHHYTLNSAERDMLINVGWSYEGVCWNSTGDVPLYRAYNPNAQTGSHHYTTSKAEFDNLISVGWKNEGVAWYATR